MIYAISLKFACSLPFVPIDRQVETLEHFRLVSLPTINYFILLFFHAFLLRAFLVIVWRWFSIHVTHFELSNYGASHI